MNRHHETNPYFVRPYQGAVEPDPPGHPRPTTTTSPRRQRHDRDGHSQPSGQRRPQQQRVGKRAHQPAPQPPTPLVPLHTHHPDEQHHLEPLRGHPDDRPVLQRAGLMPSPLPNQRDPTTAPTSPLLYPRPQATPSPAPPPPTRRGDRQHPARHGQHGSQSPMPHPTDHGDRIHMPREPQTRALTWFLAMFCAILWVVVILGGLAVLVVYLVFRPRSPRFDVSAASLNAAYLDMGYLLNADLTLLANFTNPNQKVGVDFNYMFVELYYGRTLVATQYLEPFSAPKGETRFANLHMVTSQVRLSELEVQRIKRQTLNNGIMFEVKGFFRARSNFGGLLRYSYWLHSRCTIMVTRPPGGVLVARKCKTKH